MSHVTRHARRAEVKRRQAFTLVEMLVVLAIMGIIAAMVVPAIKNFGNSDAMTAADQQMLGDVARARQLAMSQRNTVYMVFVPTNFWAYISPGALTTNQLIAETNLCGFQLTGYTFMSLGSVGDQPGQHQWNYLSPWVNLPDGTFIPAQKFLTGQSYTIRDPSLNGPVYTINGFVTNAFPFPTADSPSIMLPCIAFNYLGQLTTNNAGDMAALHELIPLAKGGVQDALDPNSKIYQFTSPQIAENPSGNSTNAYNIVDIDPLTGRASLQTPKVR